MELSSAAAHHRHHHRRSAPLDEREREREREIIDMRAAPLNPLDPSSQKATGNILEPELDIFLQFVLEMVTLPPDIRLVGSLQPFEWTLNPKP